MTTKSLFFQLFSLFFCGCLLEQGDDIKVKNNSPVPISLIQVKGHSDASWKQRHKEMLHDSSLFYYHIIIEKHDSAYMTIIGTWESIINEFRDKQLHVCIIRRDKLQECIDKNVSTIDSLYKQYDLSVEDLEKMNWTITYP